MLGGKSSRKIDVGFREGDGTFHHPLELADVSRPAVLDERRFGGRRQPERPPGTMPLEKGGRQREDVGAPLAKRRHTQVDAGQAVIEVGPEDATLDQPGQAPIGRRDDTDIDAMRSVTADPLHGKILNGPQQLRLRGRGQVGDLVEEQRASVGVLELSAPTANSGRGPLLDAEQLRLEQRVHERGAIDRDERAVPPPA